MALAAARGETPQFATLFSGGARFLPFFGLTLLSYLAYGIGFLLLVVPAIILVCGLWAASFFLVDANLGVVDSFKASWEVTKGQRGAYFVFAIVGGLLQAAGILACCVGILATLPIFFVAQAIVFLRMTGRGAPALPAAGFGPPGGPPPGYGGPPPGYGGPPPGYGGPPPGGGGYGGPPPRRWPPGGCGPPGRWIRRSSPRRRSTRRLRSARRRGLRATGRRGLRSRRRWREESLRAERSRASTSPETSAPSAPRTPPAPPPDPPTARTPRSRRPRASARPPRSALRRRSSPA